MASKRFLVGYLVFIVLFGFVILIYSTYSTQRVGTSQEQKQTRSENVPNNNGPYNNAPPLAINCSALCPSLGQSSPSFLSNKNTSPAVPNIKEQPSPDATDSPSSPPPSSIKQTDLSKSPFTNLFQDNPLKWTKVEATQTTVFSAYYEERQEMFGPSVVLLGLQARAHDKKSLYCIFQYADGTFSSCQLSIFVEMDACNEQKEYHKKTLYKFKHVFHVCRLDKNKQQIPAKVALSSTPQCNPSTSLINVYSYRPKEKANIGVCTETPIFKKTLSDVINFIEMQRLFGAQVITLYLLDSPEEMEASLRKAYSDEEGLLDIVHWSNTFKEKDPVHYYGEILAIHDCFYRNLNRVNYLALLDLDEVIVSRRHSDWHEMLQELDQDYVDSFIFLNSVYLQTPTQELPKETTRHLTSMLCPGQSLPKYFLHYGKSRCRFHYYERSKVILKPLNILDTDIHGPCRHRADKTHFFVPDDMATSQHYRDKPTIECKPNRRTKKYEVTYDDWLSRHGPTLLGRIQKRICKSQTIPSHQ